jgi:hypothetical protein
MGQLQVSKQKKVWPLIGHSYKAVTGLFAGTIVKLIDVKVKGVDEETIFVVEVINGNLAGKKMELTGGLVEKGLEDGSFEEVVCE